MIAGRFPHWNGVFGLFSQEEIEIWDTPEATNDIDALISLNEADWCQQDLCLGEWVVDCINYDPNIMPDMLIIGKRRSGMGVAFLLKISSQEEKTGYLMRTCLPECVEQSIFAKLEYGEKIHCRLVLAKPLDPLKKIIHMIPFQFDQVKIDGFDVVAFTIPSSRIQKTA